MYDLTLTLTSVKRFSSLLEAQKKRKVGSKPDAVTQALIELKQKTITFSSDQPTNLSKADNGVQGLVAATSQL